MIAVGPSGTFATSIFCSCDKLFIISNDILEISLKSAYDMILASGGRINRISQNRFLSVMSLAFSLTCSLFIIMGN